MRYLGSRQVEFPAGNRSNTVQVAVLKISSDEANAAAVDLARRCEGPQLGIDAAQLWSRGGVLHHEMSTHCIDGRADSVEDLGQLAWTQLGQATGGG